MSHAISSQSAVVHDAEIVRTENRSIEPLESEGRINAKVSAITSLTLFSLVILLPFTFGGVHPTTYLLSHVIVFLVVSANLVVATKRLEEFFPPDSTAKKIMVCLCCFWIFTIAQMILFGFITQPHPILGSVGRNINTYKGWAAIQEFLFFIVSFTLTGVYVSTSRAHAHRLVKTLCFLGFLVSLTALSHWFYDNGKLFWYFEPESLAVNPRARWPFVNPNHLAHFLLLTFFLVFGCIGISLHEFSEGQKANHLGKPVLFSSYLTSRKARSDIFSIGIYSVMLLTILITIAGTLSRGGWLGLSIGCLIFLLGHILIKKSHPKDSDGFSNHTSKRQPPDSYRTRRRLQNRSTFRNDTSAEIYLRLIKFGKLLTFLFATMFFYFFLQGRGAELIDWRIEYGLTYSMDDIRWQLYADTIPMIRDHLLMGVGLGNWASIYPRYMHHSLAGINPVYLHSDPLACLAEVGVLGILPLLVAATFFTLAVRRSLKEGSYRQRLKILALFSGIIGFFTASLLDFPLRIPAISFYLAVFLALTMFYIREVSQTPPSTKL